MIVKVDEKKVKITKKDSVNSGEYNVHECNFVFSSDYEGLIKKAVFINDNNEKIEEDIIDNKCDIPKTFLIKKGNIQLGVYAYEMDFQNNLMLRYSPVPTNFYIQQGSYDDSEESMIVDTSEGNIESVDVVKNKIAFSRGNKIIGTFEGETKNVKSTGETQTFTPDAGKYFNGIVVNSFDVQPVKNVNITDNHTSVQIRADEGYDNAIAGVDITVNTTPDLQNKTVNVNQNGSSTIQADSQYEGLGEVSVNVNVQPALQNKSVTPTTSQQVISADNNYDGLNEVTVGAIQTENKTVKSTSQSQTILPSSGKFIDEITVEAVPLQTKQITIISNGTTTVSPDSGYDGLEEIQIAVNTPSGVPDWSQIGYNYPSSVLLEDFAHSKQIYDNWDSTQTNLSDKFKNDKDLVYMPDVDTSNVLYMTSCFQGCTGLKDFPSGLDLSKNRSTNSTFSGCVNLKRITINTTNVTDMNSMFNGCTSLIEANLSTGKAVNMTRMFNGCSSLVDVYSYDITNVTTMERMFNGCTELRNIPEFYYESAPKITSMYGAFSSCAKLTANSLNNILKLCAELDQTSYTNTKTLTALGFTNSQKTTCQSLSNYQAFLDAGWTA